MHRSARCRRSAGLRVAALVVGMLGACATAAGAQTSGDSAAFGVAVTTDLAPILGGGISIDLDPTPVAGGTAPGPYDDGPNAVANLFVSSGLTGQILSTGLVEARAASSIPGSTAADADAVVNGFRGLPALTLVLQEYTNGNVGGAFGMMVQPPGALEILGLER